LFLKRPDYLPLAVFTEYLQVACVFKGTNCAVVMQRGADESLVIIRLQNAGIDLVQRRVGAQASIAAL
jgi:hypothetical protein